MNNKKNVFAVMFLVVVVSMALVGCSVSNASQRGSNSVEILDDTVNKPVKLVVVAFNGRNSASPDYTSDNVTAWVEKCTSTYGKVTVINVDEKPDIRIKEEFDIPEAYKSTTDPERLRSDAERKAHSFMEALKDITPDDPEVDYLEALHMASRELAAVSDDTEKILVILGSGISTSGVLNFQNNIIMGEAAMIADMLEEISAIPKLDGVTAIWMGLGDVVSPQKELSYSQRERLVDIWSEILTRGGASFVNPTDLSMNKNEEADLPEVTAVEFPCDPTPYIQSIDEVEDGTLDEVEPAIFNIEFIGDSSEYLDPATTMLILSDVADYMNRHVEYRPIVAGACAGDEESEYVFRLSKDRADAIKNSLVSLGVDADRITTIGLGNIKDPYHIFGVGVEGPLASQNRKVIIVNRSSPEASKLMGDN